jgi:transposase
VADHFKPLDRDTLFLMPPSVQEWIPDDHLARFVVDVVAKLDLQPIRSRYSGRGSEAYQPEMMVALLLYGYATGIFSSRRLERATYDSVAFRYITANQHPEHDTISDFRRRFLSQLEALFAQVLLIAGESGLLKVGRVSVDGTKIRANASKHHALSYGHATKLERRIKAEVTRLMRRAEQADNSEKSDGIDLPAELARREERLRAIDEAKTRIRDREHERIAAEQHAYEQRMAERAARERETGKKTGGKPPKPPARGIDPMAQINLTDEESRIMPSKDGMIQAYNAQATVDCASRLLVDSNVSQRPTDVTLLAATVTALEQLDPKIGSITELLADAGYYSAANLALCIDAKIVPYIPNRRERHAGGLLRFQEPAALAPNASIADTARHRLRTHNGRKIYGERKGTIEPAFGVIKQAIGFRQFLLRGLRKVQGEWKIVTTAYNLKRLHKLGLAC